MYIPYKCSGIYLYINRMTMLVYFIDLLNPLFKFTFEGIG